MPSLTYGCIPGGFVGQDAGEETSVRRTNGLRLGIKDCFIGECVKYSVNGTRHHGVDKTVSIIDKCHAAVQAKDRL